MPAMSFLQWLIPSPLLLLPLALALPSPSPPPSSPCASVLNAFSSEWTRRGCIWEDAETEAAASKLLLEDAFGEMLRGAGDCRFGDDGGKEASQPAPTEASGVGPFAYATFVSSEEEADASGALAHSLSRSGTGEDLLAFLGAEISEARRLRRKLRAFGWQVRSVVGFNESSLNPVASIVASAGGAGLDPPPRSAVSSGILEMFNATDYSALLFLSPRTLVTSNLDHLFYQNAQQLSAARPVCGAPGLPSNWVDTGVLLFQPSKELFGRLVQLRDSSETSSDEMGTLINLLFKGWHSWPEAHRLSQIYNLQEDMFLGKADGQHAMKEVVERLRWTTGEVMVIRFASMEDDELSIHIDDEIHLRYREAWTRAKAAAEIKAKAQQTRRRRPR